MADKIELAVGDLLTTKQLAELIGYNPVTLGRHRMEGKGIPFLKVGKKVMYRKADVDAYLLGSYVGKPLAAA